MEQRNSVRDRQSLSSHSSGIAGKALEAQIKKHAPVLEMRRKTVDRRFRSKLRELGFDKEQSAVIPNVTAGAVIAAVSGGMPLHEVYREIETAGRQLAGLNVDPNRLAGALRAYINLAAVPGDPAVTSTVDQVRFGILWCLSSAYWAVHEQEIKTLFGLFRSTEDSMDLYPLIRRFVESMAAFFEASAGHVFLLSPSGDSWDLKGSTAAAATRASAASVPVVTSIKRKLQKPVEIPARSGGDLLLDAGWSRKWPYCWSVPMRVGGSFRGVVQLAFAGPRQMLPRDHELIAMASDQTLAAAERTQLIQNIAGREQRVFDLARQMLHIEEIERNRISRELHDDAAQSLALIRLQMEMIEQSMPPDAVEWRERLAEARTVTEKTIISIRGLLSELHPAVLDQLGLAAGLRQLVSRFSQGYACKVNLHVGKLPRLSPELEIVVYRLAQECLKNISKHSRANKVNISVSTADGLLRLNVVDNGVGFHVQEGLGRKKCFGLLGMRERVALLGGSFQVRSTPHTGDKNPGEKSGTDVDIRLPISVNSPSPAVQDVVR
jgi:signal transduction histidine kinase